MLFNRLMGDMMGMGGPAMGNYNCQLKAYSVPFMEHADTQKVNEINNGGKIIMPQSSLDQLVRRHIEYPMMFKISNPDPASQRATHCGVLQFDADEGKCFLPSWMMRQLFLEEGSVVSIEYKNLPSATYAKFKPQSIDFLELSNPRAMLEIKLRNFACLTKNDVLAFEYNDKVFEFLVQEVKPGVAVSITECDMNVEFDAPEGYTEPEGKRDDQPKPSSSCNSSSSNLEALAALQAQQTGQFVPFSGKALRLDGKPKNSDQQQQLPAFDALAAAMQQNGDGVELFGAAGAPIIPDYDYRAGRIAFDRSYRNKAAIERDERERRHAAAAATVAFSGSGRTLRQPKH